LKKGIPELSRTMHVGGPQKTSSDDGDEDDDDD